MFSFLINYSSADAVLGIGVTKLDRFLLSSSQSSEIANIQATKYTKVFGALCSQSVARKMGFWEDGVELELGLRRGMENFGDQEL